MTPRWLRVEKLVAELGSVCAQRYEVGSTAKSVALPEEGIEDAVERATAAVTAVLRDPAADDDEVVRTAWTAIATAQDAPADVHMLVEPGRIRLARGPRENRHRPAVDPLFRSAAAAYGRRTVGVVLTGALDDGTAGLGTVKRCGGIAVVQDPEEAPYPSMPRSALRNVRVDHCVRLAEIAPLLDRIVRCSTFTCPECHGTLWEMAEEGVVRERSA